MAAERILPCLTPRAVGNRFRENFTKKAGASAPASVVLNPRVATGSGASSRRKTRSFT